MKKTYSTKKDKWHLQEKGTTGSLLAKPTSHRLKQCCASVLSIGKQHFNFSGASLLPTTNHLWHERHRKCLHHVYKGRPRERKSNSFWLKKAAICLTLELTTTLVMLCIVCRDHLQQCLLRQHQLTIPTVSWGTDKRHRTCVHKCDRGKKS